MCLLRVAQILPVCLLIQASASVWAQQNSPITWIPVPGVEDEFYMAQKTANGTLNLTADEVFFPQRGLTAIGESPNPDDGKLNGGKSFTGIAGWDAGDTAEWGIFLEQTGDIQVSIRFTGARSQDRFRLKIGNVESMVAMGKATADAAVGTCRVKVPDTGMHSLKLICDKKTAAVVNSVQLSGPAIANGAVLRKRWRPAAAHTKFISSKAINSVQLWVMEMDAVPGELSFYCPVTTPFGYYGPTWLADGTVNTSFNFSLWSYGRGEQEPAVEKLSHLLAIGNRDASFSGFGHEGTGVKIRDWEPLAGRQGQRQVLALRVQPGEVYDTYFSYFYAADEQRWRLFGVGNKFNKGKPLKSLTVGSFVEVPGPPPVQRTGPYKRVMKYRGWVMDNSGVWSALNHMTTGNINPETGLTHTDRGVTDDGWFYLQTGGWTFRKATGRRSVQLSDTTSYSEIPYLQPDDTAFLQTVPSAVNAVATRRSDGTIQGTLTIRNCADAPEATVYWGTAEGLTFASRWTHNAEIKSPHEGDNTFVIADVPADQTVFIRLLLKNSEGQFWTPETLKIAPTTTSNR